MWNSSTRGFWVRVGPIRLREGNVFTVAPWHLAGPSLFERDFFKNWENHKNYPMLFSVNHYSKLTLPQG